jgi:hypothetical protein
VPAAALAVALGGCSPRPSDPVRALLAELEAAAEARDADRFAACLSPAFTAEHGLTRAESLAQLRKHFAIYESVRVDVQEIEIERDGDRASVRCVVLTSGRARRLPGLEGLLPPDQALRFELDVGREGEAWLVRSASWKALEPESTDVNGRSKRKAPA